MHLPRIAPDRAPDALALHPSPASQATSAPQLFQIQQIAAALVGFLCYKAAVVGVAIIPPPVEDERSLLAQADAGGNGGSRRGADGSRD